MAEEQDIPEQQAIQDTSIEVASNNETQSSEPPYRKQVYDLLSSKFTDFKRSEKDFFYKLDTDNDYAGKVWETLRGKFSDFTRPQDEFINLIKPTVKKKMGAENSGSTLSPSSPSPSPSPSDNDFSAWEQSIKDVRDANDSYQTILNQQNSPKEFQFPVPASQVDYFKNKKLKAQGQLSNNEKLFTPAITKIAGENTDGDKWKAFLSGDVPDTDKLLNKANELSLKHKGDKNVREVIYNQMLASVNYHQVDEKARPLYDKIVKDATGMAPDDYVQSVVKSNPTNVKAVQKLNALQISYQDKLKYDQARSEGIIKDKSDQIFTTKFLPTLEKQAAQLGITRDPNNPTQWVINHEQGTPAYINAAKSFNTLVNSTQTQYAKELRKVVSDENNRLKRVNSEYNRILSAKANEINSSANIPEDVLTKLNGWYNKAYSQVVTQNNENKSFIQDVQGKVLGNGYLATKAFTSSFLSSLSSKGEGLVALGLNNGFTDWLRGINTTAQKIAVSNKPLTGNNLLDPQTYITRVGNMAGSSATSMLTGIAASAIGGTMSGVLIGGLAGFGDETLSLGGDTYKQAKADGYNEIDAQEKASNVMKSNTALLPLYFLESLGLIHSMKGFKKLGLGMLEETVGEVSTEVPQQYFQNKEQRGYDLSFGEYLKTEGKDVAIETAIGTIGQSSAMASIGEGINSFKSAISGKEKQLFVDAIKSKGFNFANAVLETQYLNGIINDSEFVNKKAELKKIATSLGTLQELGLNNDQQKLYTGIQSEIQDLKTKLDAAPDDTIKATIKEQINAKQEEAKGILQNRDAYVRITSPTGIQYIATAAQAESILDNKDNHNALSNGLVKFNFVGDGVSHLDTKYQEILSNNSAANQTSNNIENVSDTNNSSEDSKSKTQPSSIADELHLEMFGEKPDVNGMISNVQKALEETGVKFELIEDEDEYDKRIEEEGGQKGSDGLFNSRTGKIILNPKRLNESNEAGRIIWHEGAHPVMNIIRNTNRTLYDSIVNGFKEAAKNNDELKDVEAFSEGYEGEDRQLDEAIAEAIGRINDGTIDINALPTGLKQNIIDFINAIAKAIGVGQIINDTDVEIFKKVTSKVAAALKSGSNISEIVGENNLNEFQDNIDDIANGMNSSTGIDVEFDINKTTGRSPQLRKSSWLKKEFIVNVGKTLVGKKVSRVVFYDNTRVGRFNVKNLKTGYSPNFSGMGGFGYSFIEGMRNNKMILAFTSVNQAIQTLKRQMKHPESIIAVAMQKQMTAHLGNLDTFNVLFDKKKGIFQNAVTNKAEEKELLGAMIKEVKDLASKNSKEATDIAKLIEGIDIDGIKTITEFAEKILRGGNDSFQNRGTILKYLLQDKQTKITKSTREAHQILHYKYGIPTLQDIAKGINEDYFSNAELGDVVKYVQPDVTNLTIYTTDKNLFESLNTKPTNEMVKNGIKIELLPSELGHISYPFVIKGENIGIGDDYVNAVDMYNEHKAAGLQKSQSFFTLGRQKADAEVGFMPTSPVSQGRPMVAAQSRRGSIGNKPLGDNEINSLRTSLRNKFPDSYALDVLNQLQQSKKNDDLVFDDIISDLIDNGITLDNVTQLLLDEELFEDAKQVKNYFVQIGGLNSAGLVPFMSQSRKSSIEQSNDFKLAAFVIRKQSEGASLFELVTGINSVFPKMKPEDIKALTDNPEEWLRSKLSYLSPALQDNIISRAKNQNIYRARANQNTKAVSTGDEITMDNINATLNETKFDNIKNTIKDWTDKYLTSSKGLPEWVNSIKDRAQGEKNLEIDTAARTVTDLKRVAKSIGFNEWEAFSAAMIALGNQPRRNMSESTDINPFEVGRAAAGKPFTLQDEQLPATVPDEIKNLPSEIIPFVYKMRRQIDGLTQDLIGSGYVTPEQSITLEQNLGQYVNRAYKLFSEKGYKPSKEVIANAIKYLADQKLPQIAAENAGNMSMKDMVKQAIKEAQADVSAIMDKNKNPYFNSGNMDSRGTGILQERQNIPEPIRKLMGEYTDPGTVFIMTISKQAALKASSEFLTGLRQLGLGSIFFEKDDTSRPAEFSIKIASEGTDSKSPLGGLMTSPKIAEALDSIDPTYNDLTKVWMMLVGAVRWGKTVGSVITQFKNIESNLGFAVMNGLIFTGQNGQAFGGARDYIKGQYSKEELSVISKKAISLGLVGQSVGANELSQMLSGGNIHDIALDLATNPKSKFRQAMDVVSFIPEQANKLYRLGDDFWKVYAYLNERESMSNALFGGKYDTLTEEQQNDVDIEASERVKNTWPTYDRVIDAAKYISKRAPIFGNFISFQAESLRVLTNTVMIAYNDMKSDNQEVKALGMKRIAGITTYLGFRTAMTFALTKAAGIAGAGVINWLASDDDEEKKKKGLNKALPAFMRVSDKFYIHDKKEPWKYTVYDISSIDPFNVLPNSLNAITEGRQGIFNKTMEPGIMAGITQFFSNFLGDEMTFDTFQSLKENSNSKTGDPIILPSDTQSEAFIKAAKYIYNQLKPSSQSLIERLLERQNKSAELSAIAGARPYDVDLHKSFRYQISDMLRNLENVNKAFNKINYSETAMVEEKEEAKSIAEESKGRMITELNETKNEFILLGADEKTLNEMIRKVNSFKSTGFDKQTKRSIRTGVLDKSRLFKIKK